MVEACAKSKIVIFVNSCKQVRHIYQQLLVKHPGKNKHIIGKSHLVNTQQTSLVPMQHCLQMFTSSNSVCQNKNQLKKGSVTVGENGQYVKLGSQLDNQFYIVSLFCVCQADSESSINMFKSLTNNRLPGCQIESKDMSM